MADTHLVLQYKNYSFKFIWRLIFSISISINQCVNIVKENPSPSSRSHSFSIMADVDSLHDMSSDLDGDPSAAEADIEDDETADDG